MHLDRKKAKAVVAYYKYLWWIWPAMYPRLYAYYKTLQVAYYLAELAKKKIIKNKMNAIEETVRATNRGIIAKMFALTVRMVKVIVSCNWN